VVCDYQFLLHSDFQLNYSEAESESICSSVRRMEIQFY
jgi:hypothetical protein